MHTACLPRRSRLGAAFSSSWTTGPAGALQAAAATAAASRNDNPDLDEIRLDDEYYKEIGMTREQAMQQQQEVSWVTDLHFALQLLGDGGWGAAPQQGCNRSCFFAVNSAHHQCI